VRAEKALVRREVGDRDADEVVRGALFTVLTLDAFRSRRELPSLLLALASVAIALVVTPDAALFTALLLFVVLLLARHALSAVTATTHLLLGRHTILSVALGTTCYVALVNAF
jgi:branched-subunit amino acid transport protein AzlD